MDRALTSILARRVLEWRENHYDTEGKPCAQSSSSVFDDGMQAFDDLEAGKINGRAVIVIDDQT